MKSIELRNRLVKLCGLTPKQASVHSVPSKRPNTWVAFRLRPTVYHPELAYPGEIPTLYRRIALAVAYGPDSYLVAQTAAGNVGSHSISLRETEWAQFFQTVDAVASCAAADAPEALKLNVALEYLRHRNVQS